jgi:plasmid stabilization system protein ParE
VVREVTCAHERRKRAAPRRVKAKRDALETEKQEAAKAAEAAKAEGEKAEAVREVFLRTYRLVYRVHPEAVVVLAIFEGHKRFPGDVDVDETPEAPDEP